MIAPHTSYLPFHCKPALYSTSTSEVLAEKESCGSFCGAWRLADSTEIARKVVLQLVLDASSHESHRNGHHRRHQAHGS
jgi:hypothetical protein